MSEQSKLFICINSLDLHIDSVDIGTITASRKQLARMLQSWKPALLQFINGML